MSIESVSILRALVASLASSEVSPKVALEQANAELAHFDRSIKRQANVAALSRRIEAEAAELEAIAKVEKTKIAEVVVASSLGAPVVSAVLAHESKVRRVLALATGTAAPRIEPDAALVAALLRASANQRISLASQVGVKVVGLTRQNSAKTIAAALAASTMSEWPSWLNGLLSNAKEAPARKAASAARKAASSDEPRETRLDTIVGCLVRAKGATPQEIAETLLAAYPTLSARFNFAPASVESYLSFARTAIGHLQAGRLARGQYTGCVVRENGRVYIRNATKAAA